MSREIRRVPLDFDWPLKTVWGGYLTPEQFHQDACPDCCRRDYRGQPTGGTGCTAAADWVRAALVLVGMMADDVRAQSFEGSDRQFTPYGDDRSRIHPWLAALQRDCVYNHRRPSQDILDLYRGVVGRDEIGSLGADSDRFARRAMKALKAAAGLPDSWGICTTCQGEGSVEKYPGQRAECEAWFEEDHSPPTGEGWQVWETTSEGSPISPVFADREELIGFLMSDRYYGFGTSPTPLTREQAEAFVGAGSSIGSMVIACGRMIPGDAAVHELSGSGG